MLERHVANSLFRCHGFRQLLAAASSVAPPKFNFKQLCRILCRCQGRTARQESAKPLKSLYSFFDFLKLSKRRNAPLHATALGSARANLQSTPLCLMAGLWEGGLWWFPLVFRRGTVFCHRTAGQRSSFRGCFTHGFCRFVGRQSLHSS